MHIYVEKDTVLMYLFVDLLVHLCYICFLFLYTDIYIYREREREVQMHIYIYIYIYINEHIYRYVYLSYWLGDLCIYLYVRVICKQVHFWKQSREQAVQRRHELLGCNVAEVAEIQAGF